MRKTFGLIFCLLPVFALAQTPDDDRLMAHQRAIHESRPTLLRIVAPKVMPECAIAASDRDLADFFVYWRGLAGSMQAWRKEHGMPAQDAPPPSVPGFRFRPQRPLADVAKVDAATPGAKEWAQQQIALWHIYACIVHRYGADKYFAHYAFFGAPWPAPFPATLMTQPDGQYAMMAPDMTELEPLDGLGRFFRDARELVPDQSDAQYFWSRYESDYFVNLHRSPETDRWFATPPWRTQP